MAKYTFQNGGQDDGSAFFNNYVDQLYAQQTDEQAQQTEYTDQSESDDSDYIQNLRSYDQEQQNQQLTPEYFNNKISELSSLFDSKLADIKGQQAEFDWFADTDGNDYLASNYDTKASYDRAAWPGQAMAMLQQARNAASPYSTPAKVLNADSYLKAIFGNEGGTTGVDPSNVKGSASGRFAIIKDGRKMLYNKYYKDKMSYTDFEAQYKTNGAFEYDVAKKLATENILSSETAAEAIGRWYSPAHAASGKWNTIPRPDFGNKLTVGQYVEHAFKNYK